MGPRSVSRGAEEGKPSFFVSSGVPLYYQLATILREQIITGEYRVGDRLPTEADLVAEYGISRITVRQALRSLEEEGLIRREVGRGTFVDAVPDFTGSLQMDGTLSGLISMGLATHPRLLEVREVEVGSHEAAALGMQPGSLVVRAKRVRYFKDRPYCYIINNIPAEIGRKISKSRWQKGSLLKFIQRDLGIKLGDADERLRATLADANLARWLDVRIGAPLLLVEYLIRSADGRPVETAVIYYRSDTHSFTLRLARSSGRSDEVEGWSLRSE